MSPEDGEGRRWSLTSATTLEPNETDAFQPSSAKGSSTLVTDVPKTDTHFTASGGSPPVRDIYWFGFTGCPYREVPS
jgi:hypothetical protein